jgi:hypothetical protein
VQMVSALGVGTTFWFDPPCEEADRDALAVQAERRRYQRERVLVTQERPTTSHCQDYSFLRQFCGNSAHTREHPGKAGQ